LKQVICERNVKRQLFIRRDKNRKISNENFSPVETKISAQLKLSETEFPLSETFQNRFKCEGIYFSFVVVGNFT